MIRLSLVTAALATLVLVGSASTTPWTPPNSTSLLTGAPEYPIDEVAKAAILKGLEVDEMVAGVICALDLDGTDAELSAKIAEMADCDNDE